LCLACGKDVRDHTSLTTICEICGKAPTLRQPISSHFPPITSNMGLRDTIRNLRPASPGREKSSGIELQQRSPRGACHHNQVAAVQVTEQSLQVWRALPAEIRHDPSMASFQMENERIHGE